MRIAAVTLFSALALGACGKSGEPAKAPVAPTAAPRLPVVVGPSALPAAPGAEIPPAPPPPAAETSPAPPSSQPTDASFAGSFDLAGTEPFWTMRVRPADLTLVRPGHADLTAPNPGFNEFGPTAMWNATAGQSRMTVTVTKAACTDGMSDRAYAYAAKVTIWGTALSGCAARPRG